MANKYTVITMGCNEYHDIADLNAFFLKKYWNDETKKVYVTETKMPQRESFDLVVTTEENMKWCLRLSQALEKIDTPYVIMLCDDFFISKQVDYKKINELINVCVENKLGCLKLMPAADGYEIINEQLGNSKNGMYRITTMPAIWEKNYLKKLAELGGSAWDFELKGSKYSLELDEEVWCTRRCELEFVHAINKGQWEYPAIKLFKRDAVPKHFYAQRKPKSIFKHIYRETGGYVYRRFPKLFKFIRSKVYGEV